MHAAAEITDVARIWCCFGCACRVAAAAPIQSLAWEPPYAIGAAVKGILKKKEKERKKKDVLCSFSLTHTEVFKLFMRV